MNIEFKNYKPTPRFKLFIEKGIICLRNQNSGIIYDSFFEICPLTDAENFVESFQTLAKVIFEIRKISKVDSFDLTLDENFAHKFAMESKLNSEFEILAEFERFLGSLIPFLDDAGCYVGNLEYSNIFFENFDVSMFSESYREMMEEAKEISKAA